MKNGTRIAIAAAVITGAVPLGALAASSAAASELCNTTKVPVTRTIHVAEHVRRHGHVVTKMVTKHVDVRIRHHVRVKVHGKWITKTVWVIKYKTIQSCVPAPTPPSTPTTPTPPTPVLTYKAHLDPTFTQSPANPLAVTYAFSADATQTQGAVTTDLATTGALPNGILDLYSNGSLACSMNVGGAVTGSSCPVTYGAYGQQTVVTEYLPSSVSPVTETDIENIEQFSPTVTIGNAMLGSETVDSSHNWAVQGSFPITVSGSGVTPTGTITMAGGGTCTPLSGGQSTCSITTENKAQASTLSEQVNYSGNAAYGSGGGTASTTIPAAPPPNNFNQVTTTTASFTDLGGGQSELKAQVNTIPTNSTGTVTFSWTAENGAKSCVASGGFDGAFQCGPVQNVDLIPSGGGTTTVTASYSGEIATQGDATQTTYQSSSGTVAFP